jgi:hypothetical protein
VVASAESGRRQFVTADELVVLAAVLEVSVGYLIRGDDTETVRVGNLDIPGPRLGLMTANPFTVDELTRPLAYDPARVKRMGDEMTALLRDAGWDPARGVPGEVLRQIIPAELLDQWTELMEQRARSLVPTRPDDTED